MSTASKIRGLSSVVLLSCLSGVEAQDGFWDGERRLGPEINGPFFIVASQAVSADGLTLIFSASPSGGPPDLWIATRRSTLDEFGDVRDLEMVNSPDFEITPSLSSDGSRLYFTRHPPSGPPPPPEGDILVASWLPEEETFGPPRPVEGRVNTAAREGWPVISPDDRALFFERHDNLYVARRAAKDQPFAEVKELGEQFNTELAELPASISSDGLSLFFARTDLRGFNRMWMASREGPDGSFGEPVLLPISVDSGFGPSISADWPASGSKLFFTRCSGPCALYEATWHLDCNGNDLDDAEEIASGAARDVNANDIPDECETEPSVIFRRGDCTGDGKVDISDVVCALEWLFLGRAAPPCVAATNTNGDGVVDITDPVSLLGFLFLGGSGPASPFPGCGASELGADLELGCEAPKGCEQ